MWTVRWRSLWWAESSFAPFFHFSYWKCTLWAFKKSCNYWVSPNKLSLKATIIIRSLTPSQSGSVGSAFIRQMEHGCSRPQASGYKVGLYRAVGTIDRDDLNLGQDHAIWLKGWDKDKKGQEEWQKEKGINDRYQKDRDAKESKQRRISEHSENIQVEDYLHFFSLFSPFLTWPFQNERLPRMHSLSSKSCGSTMLD